ncbi:MAG: DUF2635 domain-containing protein [Desulfovibrio sp.]
MKIFIRPVDGRRVLDPVTKEPLPLEGKRVEKSSYWLRRLTSGEVETVAPKAAPGSKKKEA